MFTCIICEDEEVQRDKIKDYIKTLLNECHVINEILEFEAGEDLLNNYPEHADLIFLDIKMKELSGMDTAKKIRIFDEDVEIIFTTGLREYMQQGYEVNARRYLTKPIIYETFQEQVTPCIQSIINKEYKYLWIKSGHLFHRVKVKSIIYVETYGRQVHIYTSDQTYTTYMKLSSIEKQLQEEHFFRCQKACLVNLNYVEGITKDSVLIKDKELPVSRLKMQALKKELAQIIGENL